MLIDACFWEVVDLESVTTTVKLNVPAADGVPRTNPLAPSSTRPGGRDPPAIDHAYGGTPPVAVNCCWNGEPSEPAAKPSVVIKSGGAGWRTRIDELGDMSPKKPN